MKRTKLASSHDGRYTYWLDRDRYVYQRDERMDKWLGWLCAESVWETVFSRAKWITLEVSA